MKFLLDNNISFRLARALSALETEGNEVTALRDAFNENTPDKEWLGVLGAEGGVLVTADSRILTRPQEAAILKQLKITSFFLGPFFMRTRFWDQAVWMVRRWPDFKNAARMMEQGTCLTVPQRGKMRPI
jgi:hypothetical protein